MNTRKVAVSGLVLGLAPTLQAGMTAYDLNDVVRLRVEDISFFFALMLVAGLGIRFLWNHVAKGLPILPRMSFSRALCLTALLSLFLLLVLSMISGARELLTPGVWRRQGNAYSINEPTADPVRRESMEALRSALNDYAREHGGKFPQHDFVPEIPEKLWQAPDRRGTRYIYLGNGAKPGGPNLIAYEPAHFGEERFVLLGNGEIRKARAEEIQRLATAQQP